MAKRKKKKNLNSLGSHRRAHLIKICQAIGYKIAPLLSNRDLIYTLAEARKIDLIQAHSENADIVLAWFQTNEPLTFSKIAKPKKIPNFGAKSQKFEVKQEFYKSWEWMSGEPVRICVDHIQPLAKRWDLRLDPTNVQILCDWRELGSGLELGQIH